MRPHAKRLRGNAPRSRRREMARLVRSSETGHPTYDLRLHSDPLFQAIKSQLRELDREFFFYEAR